MSLGAVRDAQHDVAGQALSAHRAFEIVIQRAVFVIILIALRCLPLHTRKWHRVHQRCLRVASGKRRHGVLCRDGLQLSAIDVVHHQWKTNARIDDARRHLLPVLQLVLHA